MAHLYKSRLQTYAQKRNIPLPTYTVETQGPPHCRLFKAQVTIDGNTYAGPGFSSTLKDAEHEAAKVAFMSLSQDGAQDDDCLYKSLLQELAQKRGLALPVYVTNRSGPPHMPCFVSTVEISGESYVGEDARTKKQAEMNAAKVAYTALTGGGPRVSNNATAISNTVGTSSSGSSILQTVTAHKNEPTTSKIQPIINSQASYTIPSDPEKAKGYLELKDLQDVIEKHKMTLAPVVINQPQPTSTPIIVDFAKPDIKQKSHVIQAAEVIISLGSGSNGKIIKPSFNEVTLNPVMDSGSAKPSPNVVDVPKPSIKLTNHVIQAGEGPGSNGKKIQPFVNEATLKSVMGSGSAKPHPTKILIRPHVQGMTYDGPIQVADEEWVAMKVSMDNLGL
ncbi:double-stranded RNA-binding protein 4 isoform X1 [Helianthus annuus]|uniref:double-stranded RNA-binding protein 4 isoform X1 n=1 Tax=Helianthus annuus TaxID=4232 RepID=UPI001652F5F2|nr:double-stranded RNA-binding protein 4 isoform X1 [Helianthus annuus]